MLACFLPMRNNCVENPNIRLDPLFLNIYIINLLELSHLLTPVIDETSGKKGLGFGAVSGPVIHWSSWVSLPGIQSRNQACGNWEHKSWENPCGGDGMGIMKLA